MSVCSFPVLQHNINSLWTSYTIKSCYFPPLLGDTQPAKIPLWSLEGAEYNRLHVLKLSSIMFRDLSASDATEASWWHINNSFPVPLIRASSEHKQALIEKKKDNDS